MQPPAPENEADTGLNPPPLPPWEETFLARYPRKLKLGVLAALLVVLIAPWFVLHGHKSEAPPEKKIASAPSAKVEGSESDAAIPNLAPATEESQTSSAPALSPIINNQDDHAIRMATAPDSGLTEDTAEGSLPRIGIDGREPWQVYARPFNTADTRPRVAIIVAGLGLSRIETDAAIDRLPANVTLAFDVQSRAVGAWIGRARQDGHETLLAVPMEPFDYPRSDPGPHTLLTSLPNSDNLEKLLWDLRQASGYVGIMTLSGSRLTTDAQKLAPVIETLKSRGLMVVDTRVAPHSVVADMAIGSNLPVAVTTEQLDQNLAPEAVDAALERLVKTARLTGHAIGITAATPLMLDRLQVWLKSLPGQGIALAPISAMTK